MHVNNINYRQIVFPQRVHLHLLLWGLAGVSSSAGNASWCLQRINDTSVHKCKTEYTVKLQIQRLFCIGKWYLKRLGPHSPLPNKNITSIKHFVEVITALLNATFCFRWGKGIECQEVYPRRGWVNWNRLAFEVDKDRVPEDSPSKGGCFDRICRPLKILPPGHNLSNIHGILCQILHP